MRTIFQVENASKARVLHRKVYLLKRKLLLLCLCGAWITFGFQRITDNGSRIFRASDTQILAFFCEFFEQSCYTRPTVSPVAVCNSSLLYKCWFSMVQLNINIKKHGERPLCLTWNVLFLVWLSFISHKWNIHGKDSKLFYSARYTSMAYETATVAARAVTSVWFTYSTKNQHGSRMTGVSIVPKNGKIDDRNVHIHARHRSMKWSMY